MQMQVQSVEPVLCVSALQQLIQAMVMQVESGLPVMQQLQLLIHLQDLLLQ